jgi:ABC-2 type transport system ATP-binding protein
MILMTDSVIKTVDLTKIYEKKVAVDHLNLEVGEGEILGFLGPNGSGKTTTFLMLLGLSVPTSGTALVKGRDVVKESREVRKMIGALPEFAGFYGDMTARQNLEYIGALNELPRAECKSRAGEYLGIVGLSESADIKVGKFSRGMRQRLGIAQALIKKPSILLLDEPTIGVDPQGTKELRELITRLNKEQRLTIILASHLLNEVQKVCSRVAIIRSGRLVATGTINELTAELGRAEGVRMDIKVERMNPDLINVLKGVPGVTSVDSNANELTITAEPDAVGEVSRVITTHGGLILMMKPYEPSLEEIFMKYYQNAEEA